MQATGFRSSSVLVQIESSLVSPLFNPHQDGDGHSSCPFSHAFFARALRIAYSLAGGARLAARYCPLDAQHLDIAKGCI